MSDFGAELALLLFFVINAAVFGGARYFAARCLTNSRSQSILDAALLGYAVQYIAVGIPGILHVLSATSMAIVAIASAIMFVIAGWRAGPSSLSPVADGDRLFACSIAIFVGTIVLAYAHSQASLPVISNDALTYHFPAAVQWLQQKHIGLFQTWFFNPANTYSPLAGSMFIAWMMAPFGSDVLARFVEVPALFCAGIAVYRLCREINVPIRPAALIAAAAVLCRPIFLPSMMGKDDLFVAFFFITTVVAMSRQRAVETFGPIRFGIALGLLLATKYTALLIAPLLLLAVDGPGWKPRWWLMAIATAAVLAGPWYLRNWILTGNPVFPMFRLFTTSHSDAFASWSQAFHVIVGGTYALPPVLAAVLVIGWIASWKWAWSTPMLRVCCTRQPARVRNLLWRIAFPRSAVRPANIPADVRLHGCCCGSTQSFNLHRVVHLRT